MSPEGSGVPSSALQQLRLVVEMALGPAGPGVALALADGFTATPPPQGGGSSARWSGNDPDGDRITALVQLAQGGDQEAFAQIYDRYVDQVYRFVYYRVGSHALAEDLTSETFLRALRKIGTFSWQGRDIVAWFFTIARNLIADHLKSSRFRLEVSTGDMLDADPAQRAPQAAGPEELTLARLDEGRLLDALKELKPEQQECVVLRFFEELSVAETAEVMGRSVGAIKQLQLRAIRNLSEIMQDVTDSVTARLPGTTADPAAAGGTAAAAPTVERDARHLGGGSS